MRLRSSPLAVLVAALVVTSMASVPVAASSSSPHGESSPSSRSLSTANESDVEAADTVYVTETGDLILEYRDEDGSPSDGQVGLNVSEGLVHVLVSNETDSNVTGDLQATLSPTRFVGNGSLTTDRPDALQSLDFRAAAQQTTSKSAYDLDLSATVTNESASRQTGGAGSITTEGSMEVTPERYQYTASLDITDSEATTDDDVSYEYTVRETDTGYTLTVAEDRTVTRWTKPQWDTRENATETLETQYGSLATSLNGTSEVTVESYEFTNESDGYYELSIAYTIEYEDVHAAVADRLTESLAQTENLTLSESEAREVSEKIQKMDVEEVSLVAETSGESAHVEMTVDIRNYDDLARAMLDVAASSKDLDEETKRQIEESRTALDAREAAGMTRAASWSGSMTADGKTANVDLQMHSETSNWKQYVAELESRGVELSQYSYLFTARTDGDDIVSEVEVTVSDEELVSQMMGSSLDEASDDTESLEAVRKFREAGFRRGKVDVSMSDGTVTFRAAAKFENMSAFGDAMEETYGGQVESLAGRSEGDESVTYVRVTGMVGSDPSKAEVRDTPVVDDDTTIEMPGEWDRTFPSMDVRSVEEFLGYEYEAKQTEETATSTATSRGTNGKDANNSLPGFGVTAAVLALLGAALFARRRRQH